MTANSPQRQSPLPAVFSSLAKTLKAFANHRSADPGPSASVLPVVVAYRVLVKPVGSADKVMTLFLDVRGVRGTPSRDWRERFLAREEVRLLARYTERRLRRAAAEVLAKDRELLLTRWLEAAARPIEGRVATTGPAFLGRSETSGTGRFQGHSAPVNRPRGRGDL